MRPPPLALRVAALLAAGAGLYLSRAAPRLTLVNDGLAVTYPSSKAAWLLATGAGLVLLGLAEARNLLRVPLLSAGILCLLFGADALAFRLEAGPTFFSSRGLLGRTELAWKEVSRVESTDSVLVLWAGTDRQIRVEVSSFSPDQRGILDRTVARRIREGRPLR